MNTYRQAVTVLAVCAAGSLLAACGGNPAADEAAATSEPGPTTAASPSSDSRLPEGTYRTPELTVDQLVAAGVSAGFDQTAVEDHLARGDGGERTAVLTLKLEAGRWTLFEAFDGRPAEMGWSGTYQVIDADTVVATDPCGAITYDYVLHADELTIDMVVDECRGLDEESPDGELIAQTILYETAPFAKIE
jgi:hypothetical protein